MEETTVVSVLKTAFGLEILNKTDCKPNEIVVLLADGTKAKISAKPL